MSSPGFRVLMVATIAGLSFIFTVAEGASGNSNQHNTSNASRLQLKVGESFLAARAKVVRHGWTPFRMHSNDMYEYDGAENGWRNAGSLRSNRAPLMLERIALSTIEKILDVYG